MATQGYVQLPSDVTNTGKKEDHVVTDNSFYREVVVLGGPQVDDELAPVSATAGLKVDLGADNDITSANGGIVTLGANADAGVKDATGTLNAHLRGLIQIFADVWDSVGHFLKVSIQNSTLAVTQSGTWTVQPGNTANTTAWKVDGSAVTQPISAASLPLPTGAATEATLSSIDTKVPAQGQAAMAASLPVVIANNQSAVPVSAASLPLPTGAATLAEQQTQTASLSVMDDWDESDRAKVNIIVGQAGITAAAGAVAANTPRVTLASDDPAVAVLGATNGAAVITDANGTIQQYLRGLVKLAITAGSFLVTASIAAGTNLIGKVSASNETSTVYDGTTALTPKFQKIAVSSSGNNALVAAVTAKKIRVLGYNFMANGTVNAKFQSDGAGTPADLTGLKYCVANTGISVAYNPVGWFESASGKSLDINLSAGVAIGGELVYVEV